MGSIMRQFTAPSNRRILATAAFLALCIVIGAFAIIRGVYLEEKERLMKESSVAADSLQLSMLQGIQQVDMALLGLRMFYLENGSVEETGHYINRLNLANTVMEDLYLVGPDGHFLAPESAAASGKSVSDREYFAFQRTTSVDGIYISTIEKGVLTDQERISISRRVQNPDGSFGGVVVATLDPRNITVLRGMLKMGSYDVISLIGTLDRKPRAHYPLKGDFDWTQPINPVFWDNISQGASGSFEAVEPKDGSRHIYQYRKISTYSLIIMVGLSEKVVDQRVKTAELWIFATALALLLVILEYTVTAFLINRSNTRLRTSNEQLNEMNSRLEDIALYDQLTGLPSRRLLADRLSQGIKRAERSEERCYLAFMDLDGFKKINDRFGHGAGDELLKVLSGRMQKVVRPSDTVCRWGGDEFVILLPSVENNAVALSIVCRLLESLRQPVDFEGEDLAVSGSIGISCFPEDGTDLEGLQKSADQAMYRAKEQGKNQIVFASQPQKH